MRNVRYTLLYIMALLWSAGTAAQVPYSYAPGTVTPEELSALGGNKSQFVQGLVLFDCAADPALARMKGRSIKGVRCYLRADYKQARQKRSGILACSGSPGNLVQITYADFQEGWNDVMFDQPLTIGEEKIYLGVQVYETLGTPYPLVTYAAATVPQSCLVNQGKKSWEEYNDRGTLLIAALLDDDAADCLERTAYAQNTTHPQTVAPDADFTGGLYLHNFSATPITTLKIAMQGAGATTPTYREIQLTEPIGAYGSTVVTAQLHSGLTEGTSVAWSATVAEINGTEAQAGRPGTTPLYVTYDNFIRTPLVEEFTSQRCINCPQMAYFLEKALDEHEGEVIYVSHHSGFAKDAFTSAADEAVVYVFGGYENEYNPAIMYNRTVFEGENTIVQGIRDMSPEPYLEALDIAADMPAMAEVNIEAATDEVQVSGRVARDLVGKPLYISCYLVEDGITTNSYPQLGMDDADAPADLKEVFRHNGVILHSFTKEAVGDLLEVQADGKYSLTYPVVEKEGFGGTGRRIVALIHKVNKNNLRENGVLNAAQLSVVPTGVEAIKDGQPTGSQLSAVFDLAGRKVMSPQRGLYIRHGRKVLVR